MRKLLFQFVLPMSILTVAGLGGWLVFGSRARADDWTHSIRKAAAGADRLVVRDLDFRGEGRKPDREIRGADKVRELFALIDIDAAGSGFHCMCDGDYWIYVYKGDQEVLTLGYHHGRSLRWHRGTWKGDGLLTAAAQEAIPRWFDQNGCAYLQQLRDHELARKTKDAQEAERFANCFPEKVRGDVLRGASGQEVAKAIGDGVVVTVSACRSLGGSEHTWTSTGPRERTALEAVLTVDGKDFLRGMEKLRDESTGLRGAARIFFREGYHKKVPVEVRSEWVVKLATIVFADGLDDDKPSCLRFLANETDPAVKAQLVNVFRGKVGKEIDLEKAYAQEPGLRAGAALGLVMMGDDTLRPEIERMLPQLKAKADVAALEVCLALLGDPSRIKAEHFRLQSYSIGLAGLKAVERYKGAHGMEALVKGGIHHPWGYVNDEALNTFERITGRRMTPGEIEDWYAEKYEGKSLPKPLIACEKHDHQLRSVAFSPDGKQVIAGANGSTAEVWSTATGKKLRTLKGHEFTVLDAAFSPDGKRIATVSGDRTLKVWDAITGDLLRTLRGHEHMVRSVAFHPDSGQVVTASEDGTVKVWDIETGSVKATFRGRGGPCEHAVFGPLGKTVLSTGRDGQVRLWDPLTGKEQGAIDGKAKWITAFAVSPDGTTIASAVEGSYRIHLIATATGEVRHTLAGHTQLVDSVAYSPDGKYVVSTGWDKSVRVWESASGKELVSFKGHPESINAVAVSPDGKRLATASEDKSIRIWDLDKLLRERP